MQPATNHPSVGRVSLPERNRSPWWELGRRLLMAIGILVGTVLLWLYLVAIAVLIGAAVNAAFDTVFPQKTTMLARIELVHRLRRIGSRDAVD